MIIYLTRHGLSVPNSDNPNRPLSQEGKAEIEKIANYMKKIGASLNKVYHSGITRAEETAQLFSDVLCDKSIHQIDSLKPNEDVKNFTDNLVEDNVMYVGHMPHMNKLVSYLTCNDENADVLEFINGGVVCLEKTETGFHIKGYLIPLMC